ncbi:uncharacterized protein K489DRAFT_131652 [Dissoconium aciculare CBS 342.82]|uniref:Uncharacterized protein n=1 Tax=Dissoconium aciculare CBS 342.82 TaxID=1314786 RepID=A0A6J3LTY3_9PEZI|nr:uncharacterized protein K489DRAFT_131652 [Dissoconium aciculare CBS 342.82]KAF1818082.1 hypothetical protein K489DRAFT_131652 [Dissoconium aciculare CBS 342.82]
MTGTQAECIARCRARKGRRPRASMTQLALCVVESSASGSRHNGDCSRRPCFWVELISKGHMRSVMSEHVVDRYQCIQFHHQTSSSQSSILAAYCESTSIDSFTEARLCDLRSRLYDERIC